MASTRSSSPPETMSKPQPARGEGLQHGQARVGLHRVAEQVLASGQRTRCRRPARRASRARIDVQRRAVRARERVERAAVEHAARRRVASRYGAPGSAHRAAPMPAAAGGAGQAISGPFWPQPSSSAASTQRAAADRYTGSECATHVDQILSTMSPCPDATPLSDAEYQRLTEARAGAHRGHRRPLAAGRPDRHRHAAHRRAARTGVSGRQPDRRQHAAAAARVVAGGARRRLPLPPCRRTLARHARRQRVLRHRCRAAGQRAGRRRALGRISA